MSGPWTTATRPLGVIGATFSLFLTLLATVGALLYGGVAFIAISITGAVMTAFNVWVLTRRKRKLES
ncbi:hypothetical protein GCM10010104_39070 [Streptomyces indiaensis]|uniref:Secreted protein n=1 Tax=Streptomyces indiaensis TaxID=284033 RepID=A0ABN3DRE8_9ACTN